MSESERRRKYRHDRVLIETSRVLSSTFDDAVVYLSGVQLEMLRNATQYLRRLDTYVTEYNPGYYLTPTSADYDDILAIVADLEETLMGNPNTLWGFKAVLEEYNQYTIPSGGTKTIYTGTIASGELWRVDSFEAYNDTTSCTSIELIADYPAREVLLLAQANPAPNERVVWTGRLILDAGCRLVARYYGCITGDMIVLQARGNTMAVPE